MAMLRLGHCGEPTREEIGGKAFGINTMLGLGLPVPPAFVLSSDECARYYEAGRTLSDEARAGLRSGMVTLEAELDRRFGSAGAPLLVSVRSGAARSMPGMMDTVLNIGINDQVEAGLRKLTQNAEYAADTRRRFIEQFVKVVGQEPAADPWDQLAAAVAAVFESWQSPRASAYRRHHGISDDGGTAVTVQAMVFGNLDDRSGTGVVFTRHPTTAHAEPFGEWLPKGQGEDVVSGSCQPLSIAELNLSMPEVHIQLMDSARLLERTMRDVQDIEFTIEAGKLWLLQTRSAKRSADAAVRHAVGLAQDGIITREMALTMFSPEQLSAFLKPHLASRTREAATVLAKGEVVSPGVVSGLVVDSADEAEELAGDGVDVILARPTTDPNDVHGIIAAKAVVTEIGGATSHAAVVSRELDRVCVVGCGVGSLATLTGKHVTVDGTNGEILDGVLNVEAPSTETDPVLEVLAGWLEETGDDGKYQPLKSVLPTN